MTRTTGIITGLAAAALAATAVPSIAATATHANGARFAATSAAAGGKSCAVRNPGKQPTDIDDMIGQDPDRVTQGLDWYITGNTDPTSPGLHIENWGHQWFQDVRAGSSGAHARSTMVGGQTGKRYWKVGVDVTTKGVRACACPPDSVQKACAGTPHLDALPESRRTR